MTKGLHGCWASFFPVGQIPAHRRRPNCDVLFFLGILKVKVVSHKFLIHFYIINADRQYSVIDMLEFYRKICYYIHRMAKSIWTHNLLEHHSGSLAP